MNFSSINPGSPSGLSCWLLLSVTSSSDNESCDPGNQNCGKFSVFSSSTQCPFMSLYNISLFTINTYPTVVLMSMMDYFLALFILKMGDTEQAFQTQISIEKSLLKVLTIQSAPPPHQPSIHRWTTQATNPKVFLTLASPYLE